jgi:predicted transglutaminase-like cysteine proteinase
VTKRKSQTFGKSHNALFDNWKLPPKTEIGGGDCEDKAIWLYWKLIEDGFKRVRLFVGKHRNSDKFFHAWVIWYTERGNFILDPTNDDMVWPTKSYPTGFYEPYCSYFKDKKWRHMPLEDNGLSHIPIAAQ